MGSEALVAGRVTRQDLRRRYVKLHHNVYAPVGLALTARDRAYGAWLWSGRRATLAGLSAAAMHGSRWLPAEGPAELTRVRCGSPPGIAIHRDTLLDDEVCLVQSIECTTVARTIFDIGRRIPGDEAVIRIDALLNATRAPVSRVSELAARHPGERGIRRLRQVMTLVDGGAESPQETRVRPRGAANPHGLAGIPGRSRVRRSAALDGCRGARRRHLPTRLPRGAGLDHHPGERAAPAARASGRLAPGRAGAA